MKNNIELRNTTRKLYNDPYKQKTTHSQSPNHNKLLKKIEQTQRDNSNLYELSLQEELIFQKPKEEVVDFRVEIERRFQRAVANHTFVFPKKGIYNKKVELDKSTSSNESSFESLKHVTVYELNSQNRKRNTPINFTNKTHEDQIANGHTDPKAKINENEFGISTMPDQSQESDEDIEPQNTNTPKTQDKTYGPYKTLLGLMEKQLMKTTSSAKILKKAAYIQQGPNSHAKEVKENPVLLSNVYQMQVKGVNKDGSKDNRPSTNPSGGKSNLIKGQPHRTLGYHIGKNRIGDQGKKDGKSSGMALSFQEDKEKPKKSNKALELIQKFKLAQDQEKITILNISQGLGESVISLNSRLSPNPKKTINDPSKVSQDNKKNAYSLTNSRVMQRAVSPTSMGPTHSLSHWKDAKIVKSVRSPKQGDNSYTTPQTPLSSLYQKVQDDMLNGKLKGNAQKVQKKIPVREGSEGSKGEKEKVYRPSDLRGINFADSYGSPRSQMSKSPNSMSQGIYYRFSKTRDGRDTRETEANTTTEKTHGRISYETSRTNTVSKPVFKLDLSYRDQKRRDISSSNRTRDNKSKEKSSDTLSRNSIMKSSYDLQNSSLVRNGLNQANPSRKQLGVSPKENMTRNFLYYPLGN